ncbi:uncharacterized protein LOC127851387 isoform X2 [Dreissena polymorpha]|uniref:uncharacterized protein LOC127851387 isoform X2 n=1 Tax=Dreissena polymorpha TaxID=45954 RepID=UPI00226443BB|nr:uncharacterized protein LOC127851387 isoform X2 [Dreissena polymorpha]
MANTEIIEKITTAIMSHKMTNVDDVLNEHADFDLGIYGNGHHLLHIAVGYKEICLKLLELGLNVNEKENGYSSLHLAAKDDLLETTMLLLIYGADINLKSDDSKMTALELAHENSSHSVQTFLLFAGAELIKGLLEEDDEEKHRVILKGIEDKKVSVGAEVFKPQAGSSYQSVRSIKGQTSIQICDVEKQFLLVIREMETDYENSSISIELIDEPDGAHIVSRVYQYKVDRTVTCTIKVPLVGSPNSGNDKYYEYFVQSTTGMDNVQKGNVNIVGSEAVITGMTLHAHGRTSIVAFAVLARTKEETFTINAGSGRIQSVVEQLFSVDVSESRADGTTLALKVEKAVLPKQSKPKDADVSGSDEYIIDSDGVTDCSDFCSFTTSRGSLNEGSDSCDDWIGSVSVQLPAPTRPDGSETAVVRCKRGDNPNSAASWTRVDTESRPGNTNAVNVKNGLEGWYIVVIIKKFTGLVRQTVRDMYYFCVGDKKRFVMYTMIRPNTPIDVLVVVCLEKEQDTSIRKILKQHSDYRQSDYGFTSPCDLNTKKPYILVLKSYQGCKVVGPTKAPFKYQKDVEKFQIFRVEVKSNVTPAANVFCVNEDKIEHDLETISKFQQPIDFSADSPRPIPPDCFLSDNFLTKQEVTDQIEDKWFEVGLYFRIPICTLIGFRQVKGRNRRVLQKWRNDTIDDIGQCLDRAMTACKVICLPDLRQSLLEEVISWIDKDEKVKAWAKKYKIVRINRSQISHDFKQLDNLPVCPFSDAFLYSLHTCLPIDDSIFLQLGLNQHELDETTGHWSEPARRCYLLHKVRNKYDGKSKSSDFLKIIANELKNRNDNMFKMELEKCQRLGALELVRLALTMQ